MFVKRFEDQKHKVLLLLSRVLNQLSSFWLIKPQHLDHCPRACAGIKKIMKIIYS